MTPRELFHGNMRPRVRLVTTTSPASDFVIPEDPDRYAIIVTGSDTGVWLQTGELAPGILTAINGGDARTIFLSHMLHGALVNLRWDVLLTGATLQAVIMEAFFVSSISERGVAVPAPEAAQPRPRTQHRRCIRRTGPSERNKNDDNPMPSGSGAL